MTSEKTYSFSIVIPCSDTTSHKEALQTAKSLLSQINTRVSAINVWSSDDRPALLLHVYPVHQDVQPTLATWLNEDVIYEYHILAHKNIQEKVQE